MCNAYNALHMYTTVSNKVYKQMLYILMILHRFYIDFTGCPDKIDRNLKLRLLHKQNTCRKCKDSFGIVRNGAINYVLG